MPTLFMGESDTLTIDHLVIGEFVTGPPSYRLVIGEFAYSSWISTNTENILFLRTYKGPSLISFLRQLKR